MPICPISAEPGQYLLGQIALEVTSRGSHKDAVVVGFHEPTNKVFIVNPEVTDYIIIDMDDIEKQVVKDYMIKKLTV